MKRKMADSKRKTSPARDIKRTNRRPWISVRALLGVSALLVTIICFGPGILRYKRTLAMFDRHLIMT